MRNSNTIIVKQERGSKSHFGWTLLLSGPDMLYSSEEDRSVWPIGMAVPSGDDIQAEAQETLAFLKALAQKRGDNVWSENSCLSFPSLTWHFRPSATYNNSIQSITPVTRWKGPYQALEMVKLSWV